MANKKIESRYTIEYIYPDSMPASKNKTSSTIGTKLFFTTSILGLVAIGLATSIYYPSNTTSNNTGSALIDTQETDEDAIQDDLAIDTEIEEPLGIVTAEKKQVLKEVEELTQKNKTQLISPTKQEKKNKRLLQKLAFANNKLLIEKEKNKELNSTIESNASKNNKLSQMLKEAVNKANTADKRYLDALIQLKVNSSSPASVEGTTIEEESVTVDAAKMIPTESINLIHKNSVNLSNATQSQVDVIIAAIGKGDSNTIDQPIASIETTPSEIKVLEEKTINIPKKPLSQVDAIVAAMGQVNVNPSRKSINKSTTPSIIIQTSANTNIEAESLHIKLQKQINSLIKTNELQTTDYKKALTTESIVRSNAMRSITVRKGDTLWDIAKRAYGNGSFYKKIIDANPEITKKGKIYLREGQVIHVPI